MLRRSMDLNQLLGPLGLTVALVLAVGVLWRLVMSYIDFLKARIAQLEALLEASADGWREQTRANAELAETLKRKTRTPGRPA